MPATAATLPPPLARWLWVADPDGAAEQRDNHYVLFHRRWRPGPGSGAAPWLRVRLTASTTYELYIDGRFTARGPVHGDPAWTCWDELTVTRADPAADIEVAVVVHNPGPQARVSCVIPAPGGFAAELATSDAALGSDATWAAITLEQWRPAPKRGWALGWGEDVDLRRAPDGWATMRFASDGWPRAVEIAGTPWAGHSPRPVPELALGVTLPVAWRVACTALFPADGLPPFAEASALADAEPWHEPRAVGDLAAVNAALATGATVVVADLGAEHIGHYEVELEAPAGTVIDLAGAELLQDPAADGRPWIRRKGTSYTLRVTGAGGRQRVRSFTWTGCRWLHLALRSGGPLRLHGLRLATRLPRLPAAREPACPTPRLAAIAALCRRTLAVGLAEHLIDCPSREQAQYWGDGVFIAQALDAGFAEPAWLRFYLDCFIRAPFTADGQLSSVYPGRHVTLLDYSLIPLLGQRFHRRNHGTWHRAAETLAKARTLKRWYDARLDPDGLLPQLHDLAADPQLITFIDHPGLGWHDFPHPGMSRSGRSAGLNLFLLLFVRTMAEMAEDLAAPDAADLRAQERRLAAAIARVFDAGEVLHDSERDGVRDVGTSWQVNALAVLAGILSGERATTAMRAMLAGYDRLCRCSPYFHFYFLPALRRAGLTAEALELIGREWGPMLDAGATTTWEGFAGDAKDSLCHPWSTAPYLFLLEVAGDEGCAWA